MDSNAANHVVLLKGSLCMHLVLLQTAICYLKQKDLI